MGIIQLDGVQFGKVIKAFMTLFLEFPDQVLEGGCCEEVLLFEPETLTFICGIVGVQYPGDRLRFILGLYGINVIPFIKSPEIELLYRFGTPESESIDRLSAVSDYRHVIWYRLYLVFSTEFDNDRIIAVFDEPGVFVFQPWISLFDLEAVDALLFEYAVLVQYSVSRKPGVGGRPGIADTGGKTSQPAVAEARIIFCILEDIVVDPHFTKCCVHFLFDLQIGQVIAERASHQKFSREIVRLLLGPVFLF